MERLMYREPGDFLNYTVIQHFWCWEENSSFFGIEYKFRPGTGCKKISFCVITFYLMPELNFLSFKTVICENRACCIYIYFISNSSDMLGVV